MAKTFLYRHFGSKNVLLYIGISNNCAARTDAHEKASAWHHKIRRVDIEAFPSRKQALAAEKKAIRKEQPLCNSIHKKRRKSRKPRNPRTSRGLRPVVTNLSLEVIKKLKESSELGTRSMSQQIHYILTKHFERDKKND